MRFTPVIYSPSAMRSAFLTLLAIGVAYGQPRPLVSQYCVGCHSAKLKTGNLVLEGLDAARAGENPAVWERVLRQVSTGAMPPAGLPRPDAATMSAFTKSLEETLDRAAAAKPDPGAPMPHRLNRVEYSNAIRDLLGIDTNPGAMLPVDDSGNGFDNMADLLSMSPALLERYMSAARSLSRMAVGDLKMQPAEVIYGSRARSAIREPNPEDLPIGSRGGVVVKHYFPIEAEYDIKIGLAGGSDDVPASTPYQMRVPVKAGMHTIAATFLRESARAEVANPGGGRRGGPAAGAGSSGEVPPAELDLRLDGVRLK